MRNGCVELGFWSNKPPPMRLFTRGVSSLAWNAGSPLGLVAYGYVPK